MTTLGKSAPSSFSGRVTEAIRALAAEAAHNSRRHAALDVLANYVSLLSADDPRLVALHLLHGDRFSLTPEQARLLSWIGGTGKGNVSEPDVSVAELVVCAIADAQRAEAETRRENAIAREGALAEKYRDLLAKEQEQAGALQAKIDQLTAELAEARRVTDLFRNVVESDDAPDKPKAKARA